MTSGTTFWQQTDGGGAAEPRAALLPHSDHRRSVAAGPARLRWIPWKSSPSAGKNISKRCSAPTAKRREPRAPSAKRTVSWPPNCSSAACRWLPSKTHWCAPRRAGSCVLPDLRRLGTIRSLAYFSAVIEEVLELRVKQAYFQYLRHRIQRFTQTGRRLPSETKSHTPTRLRRG